MIETSVTAPVQLQERIQARTARVGILGLGYVGLPLALLFSEKGFPVTGFDIDRKKVDMLNSGKSYIVRIPPKKLLRRENADLPLLAIFRR